VQVNTNVCLPLCKYVAVAINDLAVEARK
jgi:hypothetical protein